jgi:hypothetical protein
MSLATNASPNPLESAVRLISGNTLSTADVRSPAGESVGKVVDFMLDTEHAAVRYAVLAVGGVLGVGAKMLAIPPQALAFDSGRRCLNLAVETTALEEAPGFDRANPPDTADPALLERGPQPSRSATATPRTER